MKKSIIIFFVFFLGITKIGNATRLLIGIDTTETFLREVWVDSSGSDQSSPITVCKIGFSETPDSEKTGNFEKDECGGNGIGRIYTDNPNVWFETTPLYFGDTSFGVSFYINPNNTNEIKLVNYPKDNVSAKIKYNARYVGVPLFYTFGDEELGKDGGFSFRLGLGPSLIYYDPIEVRSEGKTEVQRFSSNGISILLSIDWGYFSWTINALGGAPIVFKELKNKYGNPAKLSINHQTKSVNYVWYF